MTKEWQQRSPIFAFWSDKADPNPALSNHDLRPFRSSAVFDCCRPGCRAGDCDLRTRKSYRAMDCSDLSIDSQFRSDHHLFSDGFALLTPGIASSGVLA